MQTLTQDSEHGVGMREGDRQARVGILIRNCALLAAGHADNLQRDQDVLIRDHSIVAIGPAGTLDEQVRVDDRVIAGQGHLVVPGMINAHTHSLENLLKASSPSLPLELWLVPLFADAFTWTPRLVYLSTLLGAVEMLKTGTTGVLDHLWTSAGVDGPFLDAAMQAYKDAGIRAVVAPSIEDQDLVLQAGPKYGIDFPEHPFIDRFAQWPAIEMQVETLEAFIAHWDGGEDGRLRAFVGPSGIHWCSPRLLESCLTLAERYGTGMHLHAVETELQAAVLHETLGMGGIRYLDEMQLLHTGTSLAHTIWMDEGDLDILARTGTTVVHNPVSNLRLGSGRFPFPAALQHGVPVALGSDGSASNDNQNMFSVLKLVGLMHNQPDTDYKTWPQPAQILDAATNGGARALGLPGVLGKVEGGQLADLVMLDLETDAFLPLRDPYLHLVYCERGASVDTVIVNGTIVVENSRLSSIDEQEIRREIRERCHFNWSCFNEGLDTMATMQEVLTKLGKLRSRILQNGLIRSSF